MCGVALLLALCAAGCGGNASISMSGGGVRTVTPLPAGTSVSGGTVRVSVQGGSSTGALIGLGVLAVSVFGEGGWDGVYRADPFIAIPPPASAPELDRAPRQRAGLHQVDRGTEREPEVPLIQQKSELPEADADKQVPQHGRPAEAFQQLSGQLRCDQDEGEGEQHGGHVRGAVTCRRRG